MHFWRWRFVKTHCVSFWIRIPNSRVSCFGARDKIVIGIGKSWHLSDPAYSECRQKFSRVTWPRVCRHADYAGDNRCFQHFKAKKNGWVFCNLYQYPKMVAELSPESQEHHVPHNSVSVRGWGLRLASRDRQDHGLLTGPKTRKSFSIQGPSFLNLVPARRDSISIEGFTIRKASL